MHITPEGEQRSEIVMTDGTSVVVTGTPQQIAAQLAEHDLDARYIETDEGSLKRVEGYRGLYLLEVVSNGIQEIYAGDDFERMTSTARSYLESTGTTPHAWAWYRARYVPIVYVEYGDDNLLFTADQDPDYLTPRSQVLTTNWRGQRMWAIVTKNRGNVTQLAPGHERHEHA